MGRRSKETFPQRRHTDGHKAHEKMFNITSYQRNANQNYNDIWPGSPHQKKKNKNLELSITSHWSEWPSSKCLQTINSREGVEKRKPSYEVSENVNWYNYYMEVP